MPLPLRRYGRHTVKGLRAVANAAALAEAAGKDCLGRARLERLWTAREPPAIGDCGATVELAALGRGMKNFLDSADEFRHSRELPPLWQLEILPWLSFSHRSYF